MSLVFLVWSTDSACPLLDSSSGANSCEITFVAVIILIQLGYKKMVTDPDWSACCISSSVVKSCFS